MTASPASAFETPRSPAERANRHVLVCGVNWLGDSVMTMPAIRALRERRPEFRITMLVKPALAPLWRMQPAVDDVLESPAGRGGVWRVARVLARKNCGTAYVLPNSFRSALVPFLARVPERIGAPGHWRSWLLTRVVRAPAGRAEAGHQAFEYFDITGVPRDPQGLRMPCLPVPAAVVETVRGLLERRFGGGVRGWVGLMPGAARGPSKRWPAERFAEVGRRLARESGFGILALGSVGERALCQGVTEAIGAGASSLAGETSLAELAAVLSICRVVVANDNGGMHLAAAVGARVVAVFGMTDPATTGPLGEGHSIVRAEGVEGSRDIPRASRAAVRALESISAERVYEAAVSVLGRDAGGDAT